MSYVLHYAPDNASLIVRLALEELGVPYATRLVDRSSAEQQGPDYLARNPAGTIPMLETPFGDIAETGAILLWLADWHGRMTPPLASPERGRFLQHLFFLSNTVQVLMRMRFYPERYVGSDLAAQTALDRRLTTPDPVAMTLPRAFGIIDGLIPDLPPEPDMRDPYIGCLTRWAQLYPQGGCGWFSLSRHPALAARLTRLQERPSARRAAEAEGLGAAIFTAPRVASPPEGSAT